jgi:hypothetical protein
LPAWRVEQGEKPLTSLQWDRTASSHKPRQLIHDLGHPLHTPFRHLFGEGDTFDIHQHDILRLCCADGEKLEDWLVVEVFQAVLVER